LNLPADFWDFNTAAFRRNDALVSYVIGQSFSILGQSGADQVAIRK
jgi:hypothetical protein